MSTVLHRAQIVALLESGIQFAVGAGSMEHGRLELQRMFAEALKNASAEQGPVLAWPLVCGGSVAKRTRAVSFVHGVLHVHVPDRQWRMELESLAGDYVRALNEVVKKKVARIEFLVPGEKEIKAKKHQESAR